jgi:hypothetical protein
VVGGTHRVSRIGRLRDVTGVGRRWRHTRQPEDGCGRRRLEVAERCRLRIRRFAADPGGRVDGHRRRERLPVEGDRDPVASARDEAGRTRLRRQVADLHGGRCRPADDVADPKREAAPAAAIRTIGKATLMDRRDVADHDRPSRLRDLAERRDRPVALGGDRGGDHESQREGDDSRGSDPDRTSSHDPSPAFGSRTAPVRRM